MEPVFALDLRQPLRKLKGKLRPGQHGDAGFPVSDTDPVKGLRFPLQSGALTYAPAGVISDQTGSLEVKFTLDSTTPKGTLIQGWGQYHPLLEFAEDGRLQVNLYEYKVYLRVRWQPETVYALQLSWDHTCGITLSLKAKGQESQLLRRRLCWPAFNQQYQPFSIGGISMDPRYRTWQGKFQGWIASVNVWSAPVEAPGPISISESGTRIKVPFSIPGGMQVLEYVNPPVIPDPLNLVQLPDRLADLKKTREVCMLDQVVSKCKSEIEIFARLTSFIGNLWPHCNYWPWPKDEQRHIFWKRGHEMIPEIAAGRMGGMCGGYAHVMEEVFWSMGFDARRIQVSNHSSFEAYSNAQDRWIICDASYNRQCHLFSDESGRLLGAADMIRRFEQLEYEPNALDDVHVLNCVGENLQPLQRNNGNYANFISPAHAYDHIGIATDKTNEYGKKASTCRGKTPYAYYFMKQERFFIEGKMLGSDHALVNSLNDLCPSRNRVNADFSWSPKKDALILDLSPIGVTFPDGYRITVDDQSAQTRKSRFSWTLHAGVNRLSIQTVNKLGAVGFPLSIALWKQ